MIIIEKDKSQITDNVKNQNVSSQELSIKADQRFCKTTY